jgi:hypothetical protein
MGAWHIANGTIAVTRSVRSCGVIEISLVERAYGRGGRYRSGRPIIMFEH